MAIDLHVHSTASDGTESPADVMRAAAALRPDLIGVTDDPIVSSDVIGCRQSLLFDARATLKAGKKIVKVLAWYESLGQACRVLDDSWMPRHRIAPATTRPGRRPICKPRDPELERLRPAGYVSPDEEDCEPAPVELRGCGKDSDCKGDRVCEAGRCTAPGSAAPAAPPRPERRPITPGDGGEG